MSFMSYRGFDSNILLELLGIKYCLLVTWDKGFRKVICNSDSTDAIQLIYNDFNKYYLFEAVIFYIKKLLWNLKVCLFHTLHEVNSCAYYTAKLAATNDSDLCIWENLFLRVCPLLLSNSLGCVYLKVSYLFLHCTKKKLSYIEFWSCRYNNLKVNAQ